MQGKTWCVCLCAKFFEKDLLYALQIFQTIEQEPKGDFFGELSPSAIDGAVADALKNTNVQQDINPGVFMSRNRAKDIDFDSNQELSWWW